MSLVAWSGWQSGIWSGWEEAAAIQAQTAPGGSGRRYNFDSLDLNKWSRKKKRLQKRVEDFQREVQLKRDRLEAVQNRSLIETLKKEIRELQAKILQTLVELDELNKVRNEIEMNEVVAAYLAYRSLH